MNTLRRKTQNHLSNNLTLPDHLPSNLAAIRAEPEQTPPGSPLKFFEGLLRGLDHISYPDAKDRWLIYLGLRSLYAESKLPSQERDARMLQATWKMLYPFLEEHGLLKEFIARPSLQEMMTRFLSGQAQERSGRKRVRLKKEKRNAIDTNEPAPREMQRALDPMLALQQYMFIF